MDLVCFAHAPILILFSPIVNCMSCKSFFSHANCMHQSSNLECFSRCFSLVFSRRFCLVFSHRRYLPLSLSLSRTNLGRIVLPEWTETSAPISPLHLHLHSRFDFLTGFCDFFIFFPLPVSFCCFLCFLLCFASAKRAPLDRSRQTYEGTPEQE